MLSVPPHGMLCGTTANLPIMLLDAHDLEVRGFDAVKDYEFEPVGCEHTDPSSKCIVEQCEIALNGDGIWMCTLALKGIVDGAGGA